MYVAEPLFSAKRPISEVFKRFLTKPAWINRESENLRDSFLQMANLFSSNKTEKKTGNIVDACNVYKRKARASKIDQNGQHINILLILRELGTINHFRRCRTICFILQLKQIQ